MEDSLNSSYPPSIAFKAAQMQDNEKAVHFLRKIREFVFLQKKNITKWAHISEAARLVGLDVEQLKKDYDGQAEELFNQDLLLASKMRVRGFPTLFFMNKEGQEDFVYGFRGYEEFESKILKLYPIAEKEPYDNSYYALFKMFESLTDNEFSELSRMDRVESEKYLQDLCKHKQLNKISIKNGNLYFK